MIYQWVCAALLGVASAANFQPLYRGAEGTGEGISSSRNRGSKIYGIANTAEGTIPIYYGVWDDTTGFDLKEVAYIKQDAAGWPQSDHIIEGDEIIGNKMWTRSGANGAVYLFKENTLDRWSLQATFAAPAPYLDDNTKGFASYMAVDHSNYGRSFAVGCPGCNLSGQYAGEIFVYDATDPHANEYEFSQRLTVPYYTDDFCATCGYFLGGEFKIDKDVLLGSVATPVGGSSGYQTEVFTKGPNGIWSHQQRLSIPDGVTTFNVWDDTIILTSASTNTEDGAAYVYRSNRPGVGVGAPAPPKVAPKWSLQQVLLPRVANRDGNFGTAASGYENTLVITASGNSTHGAAGAYIFERSERNGKWSVQQFITPFEDGYNYGSPYLVEDHLIFAGTEGVQSHVYGYSEDKTWKCLIVNLQDQFGDGWGDARLAVQGPDGKTDYFFYRDPACEFTGSYQFRYCPYAQSDEGLYKFSIVDGIKSKYFWEILWSVTDEATGEVYRGDHATTLDFHFDSVNSTYAKFVPKAMKRTLEYNATCHVCDTPHPPVPKLGPRDPTPAPTSQEWQYFTMDTTSAWFRPEYESTYFYISDKEGHRLISSGTICDMDNVLEGRCWQNIRDGEYVLRVSGMLNPTSDDNTWSFCGATGGAGEQLVFKVEKGECTVIQTLALETFCAPHYPLVEVVSTVTGQMVISGVGAQKTMTSSIQFTDSESTIVKQTLASMYAGLTADDISVVSVAGMDDGSLIVSFSIAIKNSAFGLSPVDLVDQEDFVSTFMTTMSGFTSERLYSRMMPLVAASHSSLLASMNGVSVTGLQDAGVTTSFSDAFYETKPDELTHDVFTVQEQVSASKTQMSGSISMYVGILVAAFGVVAVAVAALIRGRGETHTPVALPSSDVESTHASAPVDAARPKAVKTSGLNRNMMEGLVKMVQDEDAALAKAMSDQPFH